MSQPRSRPTSTIWPTRPKDSVSPPHRVLALPPSPLESVQERSKAVSQVLRIFSDSRQRKLLDDEKAATWIVIPLTPREFVELEQHLEADDELNGYVQDKIRADWHPWRGRFIIRMSTRIHEIMIGRVERVILAALADIVFDPATPSALVALVRRVEPMRHSYFSLGPDQGRSSPDASYGHLEACWPSVVIEVSYSQKKKDLKELARDYIFHSQANVRLVVGIDIDYRRTKVGVVSVWRAERSYLPDGRLHLAARRVVTNQRYRDEAGLLVDGAISIGLADFLPHSLTANAPGIDREITIPHEIFKNALEAGETSLAAITSGYRACSPPLAGVVMESDSSGTSPSEEMTSSDERLWSAREASVERRTDGDDISYG